MKRILIALVACLILASSQALGSPNGRPVAAIHLAFNDCGSFGASDLLNACDTNTGAIVIVGSMVPPASVTDCIGAESIVNLAQSAPLSDWWRFDAAGCNAGRLTGDFFFPGTSCMDPFSSQAIGGLGITYPGSGSSLIPANSERLNIYCTVDASVAVTLDAGSEYYLFNVLIHKTGSVGGCAGCDVPTALCFSDLLIGRLPGLGDLMYQGDGAGQCVSYNGGNTPTAAHGSSWGSIKSLYR